MGYEVERASFAQEGVRGLLQGLRVSRKLLLLSAWRDENRKEVVHLEGTRVGGAGFDAFVGNSRWAVASGKCVDKRR